MVSFLVFTRRNMLIEFHNSLLFIELTQSLLLLIITELMVKISEFCGSSMTLKCSLPNGDLETLISVTNDEDLSVIINLYERASSCNEEPSKIRAILSPIRPSNKVSPSSSSANLSSSTESTRSSADSPPYSPPYMVPRPAVAFPKGVRYGSRKLCLCNSQLCRSSRFLTRGPSCLNFCQS